MSVFGERMKAFKNGQEAATVKPPNQQVVLGMAWVKSPVSGVYTRFLNLRIDYPSLVTHGLFRRQEFSYVPPHDQLQTVILRYTSNHRTALYDKRDLHYCSLDLHMEYTFPS